MTLLLACFEAKIYFNFLFTNHLCLRILPKSLTTFTFFSASLFKLHLCFNTLKIEFVAHLQTLIILLSFVDLLCFVSGAIEVSCLTSKFFFDLSFVLVVSWVWLSGEFAFFFWTLFPDKFLIWFSLSSASPLFWLPLGSGISSGSIAIPWLKLGVSFCSVSSLLSVLFSVSAFVLDLVNLFLYGFLLSSEFSVFSYSWAWSILYSCLSKSLLLLVFIILYYIFLICIL